VDPLFRQGHASQVFEVARILFDQVIPPDRKARQPYRKTKTVRQNRNFASIFAGARKP
jgi:hypothetical protein